MPHDGEWDRSVDPIRGLMELVSLALLCVTPWGFAAVSDRWFLRISATVAALMTLWAFRGLIQRSISIELCPFAFLMIASLVVGTLQLVPIPWEAIKIASPGTATLYETLVPATPEILPNGEQASSGLSAARPLSVNSYSTRGMLGRLIVAISFFLAVTSVIASPASFRRMAVVVTVNGAALSMFGIFQYFTTPDRHTIYWDYTTPGTVFGPFINRNHFALYMTVSIGIAIGLLVDQNHRAKHSSLLAACSEATSLAIVTVICVMASAICMSASRGGFISLICASVATLAVCSYTMRTSFKPVIGVLLAICALTVILCSWLGVDELLGRMDDITVSNLESDGRIQILSRSLPVIQQFGLTGTGFGTFSDIEGIWLHNAADNDVIWEYAHNDYLEDLIEGGVPRFLIRLLGFGALFFAATRLLKSGFEIREHRFAIGGLFAMIGAAVHSGFDNGLSKPCTSILFLTLAAHICHLDCRWSSPKTFDARRSRFSRLNLMFKIGSRRSFTTRGLGTAVAAIILVVVGLTLIDRAWRIQQANELFEGSITDADDSSSASVRIQITSLTEASRLVPQSADVSIRLAEACFAAYESAVVSGREQAAEDYLNAGLKLAIIARDSNPTLAASHVKIAKYAHLMKSADPQLSYLDRARFLQPADFDLFYLVGMNELNEGRLESSYSSFQASLDLSDARLPEILSATSEHLSREQLLQKVLPDNPDIIVKASRFLFIESEDEPHRVAYFQKASNYFSRNPPEDGSQWFLKARVEFELGLLETAIHSIRQSIIEKPLAPERRLLYARLLVKSGRQSEAKSELRIVLSQSPGNEAALRLAKEIVEGNLLKSSSSTD